MLITFIDNTIPFDGHSPNAQPLGGPQKSIARLALALAKRGHTVRVFNRCEFPLVADGVSWQPLADCRAAHTDWLIVHRDLKLFDLIQDADKRALWMSSSASNLIKTANHDLLKAYKPLIVLQGVMHNATVPPVLSHRKSGVVAPGVGEPYLRAEPMPSVPPSRAIVTTHPLHGLDWLLDLWMEKIFPRVPWAELHVYSASLERGAMGAQVPDKLQPVLAKAMEAREKGVKLFRPMADPEMVNIYRDARVHLYPGHEQDVLCTTLTESQAVGLPAVARLKGAVNERVINGQTGYLVPDDDAFANVAVRLLDDQQTFAQLSDKARELQSVRTWDQAAQDLESLMV